MKYYLCIFILIGLNYSLLFSQTNIAVIDLDSKGISKTEAGILTDRLRIELFNTGKFKVLEREKMDEILKEQGIQQSVCTTDECVVEVGKLIGVEQMIAGSVSKFGKIFSISTRIVHVQSGEIVKTAVYDHEGKLEDLLKIVMREIAHRLSSDKTQLNKNSEHYKTTTQEIASSKPMNKFKNGFGFSADYHNTLGFSLSTGYFSNIKSDFGYEIELGIGIPSSYNESTKNSSYYSAWNHSIEGKGIFLQAKGKIKYTILTKNNFGIFIFSGIYFSKIKYSHKTNYQDAYLETIYEAEDEQHTFVGFPIGFGLSIQSQSLTFIFNIGYAYYTEYNISYPKGDFVPKISASPSGLIFSPVLIFHL